LDREHWSSASPIRAIFKEAFAVAGAAIPSIAAHVSQYPGTIIAFRATANIGAVWSVCAPNMAAPAAINRLKQIEPKFLIACDG
jgi:acyl-coenzyme A synthetase/AMP-(fatty) acid ligase